MNITLEDIENALKDERFVELLPEELKHDYNSYLSNIKCPCNKSFFKKIIKQYPDLIKKYYPNKEIFYEENISKNNWSVINCSIYELENELKKLNIIKKQIAIARYEDQITLVINES